jgi:hypothetical protein
MKDILASTCSLAASFIILRFFNSSLELLLGNFKGYNGGKSVVWIVFYPLAEIGLNFQLESIDIVETLRLQQWLQSRPCSRFTP